MQAAAAAMCAVLLQSHVSGYLRPRWRLCAELETASDCCSLRLAAKALISRAPFVRMTSRRQAGPRGWIPRTRHL